MTKQVLKKLKKLIAEEIKEDKKLFRKYKSWENWRNLPIYNAHIEYGKWVLEKIKELEK